MKEKTPEAGGLFTPEGKAVPLKGVAIDIQVRDSASSVTVNQRFQNTEKVAIEAVYSFPLEEQSAVCGFTILVGERKIVGLVKEKDEAFEQYDQAIAEGHTAYLLDQDRPNIFTVSVGNLQPGAEALVQVSYVAPLVAVGNSLRLMIPTTISPRYIPDDQARNMDPAELDHITPPTVIGEVPYGLSLKADIVASSPIASVQSPSHPITVSIDNNRATVSLTNEETQLNQDFVLTFETKKTHEPGVFVGKDKQGNFVAMINYMPQFSDASRTPRNVIFIVDRSGSMSGESIDQAKKALQLCLRSLHEGDTFNIIGFGSNWEMLFEKSVTYNQGNLDRATKHVMQIDADLGGTDIKEPLDRALAEDSDFPTEILLLTDGQVGNEQEVIELAGKAKNQARIFTFGIGRGASEFLVRGLARASNGSAEFIFPGEKIQSKVMAQFTRIGAPAIEKVKLDWGEGKPDLVAPFNKKAIYKGEVYTVYARFKKDDPITATLSASFKDENISLEIPVRFDDCEKDQVTPVLMAREAITDLEEGRSFLLTGGSSQKNRKKGKAEKAILELALEYQLMSSMTSFIAVDETVSEPGSKPELRRVPIALTDKWGGIGQVATGAMPPAMAVSAAAPMPQGRVKSGGKERSLFAKIKDSLSDAMDTFSEPEEMDQARSDAEEMDPLMEIVFAQRVDGSFAGTDKITNIGGIAKVNLTKIANDLSIDESLADLIIATCLALNLFKRIFADRKTEWELLAKKAEGWLQKQNVSLPEGSDSLQAWIEARLGL